MNVDRLRECHRARPFARFLIHMADGRALEVRHPEYISISPAGRTAAVYQPDGSLEIVDVRLVTSLEIPADRSESA